MLDERVSYYIIISTNLEMFVKREKERQDEGTLKQLIKKRKEIIEKIQKLTKKRHFLLLDSDGKKSQQNQQQVQGKVRKLVKRQHHYRHQHPNLKVQLKKQDEDAQQGEEEKNPHEDKKPNIKFQRNRRLFGGLTTHLKKAKSNIEAEKQKVTQRIMQTEEKNRVLEKVLQKEKERNEELIKEELERIEIEINEGEKQKEENAKQILKIQNFLLLKNYKTYADQLKSFIFTKSQPSVSWQPAKEFDMAKKLLGEKQKQIDQKCQAICQSIQNYEERFDYSQYLLENQKQYYSGLLLQQAKSHKPFLLTKAKPQIFWKPTKIKEPLKTVAETTKQMVSEKLENGIGKWEQYYVVEQNRMKMRDNRGEGSSQQSAEMIQKEEQEDD